MTPAGWLLLANHATSLPLVLLCWWHAHSYALARPPGRFIAAALALAGLSLLVTTIGRGLGLAPGWWAPATKGAFVIAFIGIAIRRRRVRP